MKLKVTPLMAKEWLGRSEPNYRALSRRTVAAYARSMRNGTWKYNGESIKLNCDGSVVDGQHRLHAVIESGVSIMVEVIEGISDVTDIDTGRRRQFSDVLHAHGYNNTTAVAAALGYVMRYGDLCRTPELKRHLGILRSTAASRRSNMEMLRALTEDYPSVVGVVKTWNGLANYKPLSKALSWTLYLARRSDATLADDFFNRIKDGVDLADGSPELAIRRWLETDVLKTQQKASVPVKGVMIIRAWNAWLEGRTLKRIGFRPTDTIPLMVGCEMLMPEGRTCSTEDD